MKHLVLLGADHVHVHLLARLAQRARKAPLPFRVTLIAPYPHLVDAAMLPGLVAGHYNLSQCSVALDGLLKASGVNYVQGRGTHIDAAHQSLVVNTATSSTSLDYDVLSVNTEPVMEREPIEKTRPGAREHALFLRPINAFPALWERLQTLATHQALRIAVIGAEAAGVELAFAIRQRLPHCAVTLVCGGAAPLPHCPEGLQQRVLRQLKACGITVLPQSCTAIGADHIVLDHVTALTCDAPVLTLGAQAPRWLARSGLELDEGGSIAVNRFQQSSSHPQVFASGDVASRIDTPQTKGGGYAVRAATNLATNLLAALSGLALQPYTPPNKSLTLLSCGTRYAIAGRGNWSAQGRWVWYWKDWIDRRLLARAKVVR